MAPASASTQSPPSRPSPPDPVASFLCHKWSITTFARKALCGALLPIAFEHVKTFLARVLDHLVRHAPHRNRESAIERCLRRWSDDPGEASN